MRKCAIFSFFTGAGFLDLGFEDAGFKSVFANEISPEFSNVYRYSREKMSKPALEFGLHITSIDNFLENKEDIDFLRNAIAKTKETYELVGFIGGPPCPDFSVAGKNKGAEGVHGRLSQSYIDLICNEKPDFFVFENVKGLWKTARHREFYNNLVQKLQNNGYATTSRLINALEYGAPQDRERIILIGIRENVLNSSFFDRGQLKDFPWRKFLKYDVQKIKQIDWPIKSPFSENAFCNQPDNIISDLTVQYWFEKNDVTNHPNGNDYFIPRSGLIKMKTYDEGDVSKKCYKRLHRFRYSPTAAYGNNEVHLHPYKARRLSVAEALAIQSLPREFELPQDMTLSAKFKTIGNGVPYLAANGVAKTLKYYLDQESED